MFSYLLKRILIMIPTFIGISLIVFLISVNTPGDPVQLLLEKQGTSLGDEQSAKIIAEKISKIGKKYHFDTPLFYFRITDQTQSDTLYRITEKQFRKNLSRLSFEHGEWELINAYHISIKQLSSLCDQIVDATLKNQIIQFTDNLKKASSTKELIDQLLSFKHFNLSDLVLKAEIHNLEKIIIEMTSSSHKINRYIPHFIWFGCDNQYHYWITSLISGNLGNSYFDTTPVLDKIKNSLVWTLLLSILSILVSYSIAIPLGVYLAKNRTSKLAELINTLFFAIYCIPSFWLASILIIFLASPEYFQIFPSYGLGTFDANQSLTEQLMEVIPHLVLPLICFSYSSIAYISEQTKRSILQIENAAFIKTARAKGLSSNRIYWKHILKNASFTLITQLGNLIPTIISGSFVVEYIFAIPGMGKLLVDSLINRDYPTVFSTIMISSVLVMVGVLLSDFLYMKLDPRVSFLKNKVS